MWRHRHNAPETVLMRLDCLHCRHHLIGSTGWHLLSNQSLQWKDEYCKGMATQMGTRWIPVSIKKWMTSDNLNGLFIWIVAESVIMRRSPH